MPMIIIQKASGSLADFNEKRLFYETFQEIKERCEVDADDDLVLVIVHSRPNRNTQKTCFMKRINIPFRTL